MKYLVATGVFPYPDYYVIIPQQQYECKRKICFIENFYRPFPLEVGMFSKICAQK